VQCRCHLGSTSLTLDANGGKAGELKYYPYGETRSAWGGTPTDRRFTGQRQEDSSLGSLYDFNARFYSPYLNRWLSPDTIVPDPSNPQSLNRYSYVRNNPLRYTDPTGHCENIFDIACLLTELGIAIGQSGELGKSLMVSGYVLMTGANQGMDGLRTAGKYPEVMYSYARTAAMDAAKSDRHALGAASGNDLTGWLMNTMRANASGTAGSLLRENLGSGDPFKQAGAMNAWIDLVRAGGEWDYKRQIRSSIGENIQLGGHSFLWDVPANINFGFVGRAIGIARLDLLTGAGAAQIYDGSSKPEWWYSLYDDPRDRAAIMAGMDLFDQYGLDFTLDDLKKILGNLANQTGE
jgi:RHS repeat-associated protein